MINIPRHPIELTKYPDKIDIHNIVTGLPRIKNVFARDLSFLVNQRVNKISIEGITALSTTPNMKRMTIKILTSLIIPVAVANAPHNISDQKINFFVLLLAA
jgi:hypothetical protein